MIVIIKEVLRVAWPPGVQRSVAIRTPSPPSIMHCNTPLNCTGVYNIHCIFCTGVYILHRGVRIFCTGVYILHPLSTASPTELKAARAFALLPMCNNCLGREFGQEQRSEHAHCTTNPSLCSISTNIEW